MPLNGHGTALQGAGNLARHGKRLLASYQACLSTLKPLTLGPLPHTDLGSLGMLNKCAMVMVGKQGFFPWMVHASHIMQRPD